MASRLRIIVTGLIAQHPQLGGVTWDYLQYVIGLKEMGHDVFYFEDSGEWPYLKRRSSLTADWSAADCTANVSHLASVMKRFGLDDRWAYRFPLERRWFGLSDRRRREVVRSADLLLNVSGTLEYPSRYRQAGRLAYIDSDPVFTQVRLSLPANDLERRRFRRRVAQHDVHFSFGELVHCADESTSYHWRPTRQPIVLSQWAPSADPVEAFTTVMNWTSYEPLRYKGRLYAQKDAEFVRFLDLPQRVSARLEVALGGTTHAQWQSGEMGFRRSSPRRVLRTHGWRVVPAEVKCGGLDAYRRYIRSSKAEWSVAKSGYVVGNAGWFSCRSACYLASGRPVVVQDTGFSSVLPVGEGLVAFTNAEEAVAGIEEIERAWRRHARAARAIAEEHFESRKVLASLIDRAAGSLA